MFVRKLLVKTDIVGESLTAVVERFKLKRAARFLLKPGRKYEEAVKLFQPYDQTKEVYEEARAADAALLGEGLAAPKAETFIYVNNRMEGNALSTIKAMVEQSRAVGAE